MKKILKTVVCLILSLIIPLSFVSCKSSSNGGSVPDSGNLNNNNSGGGDNQVDTPAGYVLDKSEANRILVASYDVCSEFINDLNETNWLSENNYPSSVGNKTYSLFNYVFYPARYAKEFPTEFEINKVYAYDQQTSIDYFEIETDDANDKIFVTIMYKDRLTDAIESFFYEYSIEGGNIKNIKLSYLYSEKTMIKFGESIFNVQDSILEIGIGSVHDFGSSTDANKKFLENNFTSEKFAQIGENHWSYSYYQKFKFGQNKTYKVNDETMPNNRDMSDFFGKFGFVNAYNKLEEFSSVLLTNLGNRYFAVVSGNGNVRFNSSTCDFDIEAEEV